MHNVQYAIMVTMKMKIWLHFVVTVTFQCIKAVTESTNCQKGTGCAIIATFLASRKDWLCSAYCAQRKEEQWNQRIYSQVWTTVNDSHLVKKIFVSLLSLLAIRVIITYYFLLRKQLIIIIEYKKSSLGNGTLSVPGGAIPEVGKGQYANREDKSLSLGVVLKREFDY